MTEQERMFARELAEKNKKAYLPKKLSNKDMWRLTVDENSNLSENSKDLLNQLESGRNIMMWVFWILFGGFMLLMMLVR